MATIKDIAMRLGISNATVSMALNGRVGVSPETKKMVLAVADEIGYVKSPGRSTATPSGTIGFVVYKKHGRVVADTQFFSELIQAIEHSARLLGYGVSIIYCTGDDELRTILEKWPTLSLDAALVLATEMTAESMPVSLNVPMLLLDCNLLDCDADKVLIDNEDGIRKAVKHLYAHGHREIGYFHSAYSIKNFEERAAAYRACMADLGLAVNEDNIFLAPPSTDGAFDAVYEMLQTGRRIPKACIADNDIIACGAFKAIKKHGLSIPGDVSLIGFDDVPIATLVDPELTSVHVPREALAGLAVKQLIRRIGKQDAAYTKIRVATQIVARSTVVDNSP